METLLDLVRISTFQLTERRLTSKDCIAGYHVNELTLHSVNRGIVSLEFAEGSQDRTQMATAGTLILVPARCRYVLRGTGIRQDSARSSSTQHELPTDLSDADGSALVTTVGLKLEANLHSTLSRMFRTPISVSNHASHDSPLRQFSTASGQTLSALRNRTSVTRMLEIWLLETISEAMNPKELSLTGNPAHAILRAVAVMQIDPAHNWSVENLAHEIGYSRARFAREFREQIGLPPMTHLRNARIKLARTMLAVNGAKLRDVAICCGYSSESALHRAMKASRPEFE